MARNRKLEEARARRIQNRHAARNEAPHQSHEVTTVTLEVPVETG